MTETGFENWSDEAVQLGIEYAIERLPYAEENLPTVYQDIGRLVVEQLRRLENPNE